MYKDGSGRIYETMERLEKLEEAINSSAFILLCAQRGYIFVGEAQQKTVKNSIKELTTVLCKTIEEL